MIWYEVGVDNTPGVEVSTQIALELFRAVETQPWGHLFWRAFETNKKATLYESL